MKDLIEKEHDRLNGKWHQIYVNENGVDNPVGDEGLDTITEFYNGMFIVRTMAGKRILEGGYKINPLATPAEVDWSDSVGPDSGKTFPAIYKLSEETFEFCAADEGMGRPNIFEAGAGHTIRRFIRVNENTKRRLVRDLRSVGVIDGGG